MSNNIVANLGQSNLSGDNNALFLKVFSGMVMANFDRATVTMDKHTVRTISSGKSAAFPATGKVQASYHTPGAELLGQSVAIAERVISIDDFLVAPVFVADIEEAKNHFEVRSKYARQCGVALAVQWDKNILQVMALGARASATIVGGNGGTSLTSSGTLYRTSATDLAAGIYAGVQAMDEKDVPLEDEKNAFVLPAQYYLLAQSTALVNRDWAAGNGNYSDGKVMKIGGANLIKTNNLPNTNVGTGPTAYQGDFARMACVISTPDSVGTVKLLDMSSRMDYDPRRLGTLITAKYAIGHGILRPECCVELRTTS